VERARQNLDRLLTLAVSRTCHREGFTQHGSCHLLSRWNDEEVLRARGYGSHQLVRNPAPLRRNLRGCPPDGWTTGK
jgi:hypothetical protein